jgi:predicted ATPase/class 3 adenylate cyclase
MQRHDSSDDAEDLGKPKPSSPPLGENGPARSSGIIRTPDQRLRVFVSSTLEELAPERAAVHEAITRLHLTPVLFELGARPHPPRDLYRAYLEQSSIFVGIYWQRYGWVAPGMDISGLEDEYRLSGTRPKLIYVKKPAPEREPGLQALLDRIRADDTAAYKPFSTPGELRKLLQNDLAVLLTERFEQAELAASATPAANPATAPAPRNLPAGTVTFLFTDIEGSTRLLQQLGPAYAAALVQHQALLRAAFVAHGGVEVDTQGDAFFVAFASAPQAVAAAADATRALADHTWPEGTSLRVRIGLHTGAPQLVGDRYVGLDVHRAARIAAAGHGGQVLLSEATRALVEADLPEGVTLLDLGDHRLKDLQHPEHMYQLVMPGLPDGFPPLKTLDAHPNNLPTFPTPLIGRERELETLRTLVLRDNRRLVTLHGPGGAGKTRLSVQAAAEMSDDFPDGIFFVPLAAVQDPNIFLPVLAQTVGVRESGNQPLKESFKTALSQKTMLLVLDNLEPIADATAPVIADLLLALSGLKLLVTSQALLHVQGEYVFEVPPLALPERKRKLSVKALLQYPAIQLFVERAQAIKPDFDMTDATAPAIAEICAGLDGLPLAIELAAARTKVLTPQAILERLGPKLAAGRPSGGLKLLTGGARDLPARQQTLRNTLAWSHDLLAEPEQALFRRLAGFVGGWTLEAAEAVCPAAGALDLDVLDGLESLADKSLIRHEEGSSEGEMRFLMLQVVREYALELLAQQGESEALRRAHADYYLTVAQEAERALAGPEQGLWLGRLEDEHENLRAALEWARDTQDAALALQLAGTLGRFWVTRGYHGEGRDWLRESLALDGGDDQALTAARAKALHRLATIYLDVGDYTSAAAQFEEALSLYRTLGDQRGMAIALNGLGGVARYQGNYARAQALFEESLALLRAMGDREAIPGRLMNLGQVVARQGDYARAEELFEESLGLSREQGNSVSVALTLENLGLVAFNQGDLARSARLYRESLTLAWQLGMKYEVAVILNSLGKGESSDGHLERAAQLLGTSAALLGEIGVTLPADEHQELAQLVGHLREALGEEAFNATWDKGRSVPLGDIVSSVLAEVVTG